MGQIFAEIYKFKIKVQFIPNKKAIGSYNNQWIYYDWFSNPKNNVCIFGIIRIHFLISQML